MGFFDSAGTSSSWLDMLARNPHGWGNLPPETEQPQPKAIFDEWEQPHEARTGKPLYGPDPTLLENLRSLGELPARTVSPYNLDTGEFQVPPMLSEPAHALSRVASSGGLPDPQDPQNQHDISTLLMTVFGGNAMAPARAGEAAVAKAGSHLRPGLSLDGHKGPTSTDYQLMMNDQNIGRAYVREYPETVQIGNFSINPDHQRQGIGTEVQREIARLHGKPNVPDTTLLDPELRRWQKNDPAAVADYAKLFEGASSSVRCRGPISSRHACRAVRTGRSPERARCGRHFPSPCCRARRRRRRPARGRAGRRQPPHWFRARRSCSAPRDRAAPGQGQEQGFR